MRKLAIVIAIAAVLAGAYAVTRQRSARSFNAPAPVLTLTDLSGNTVRTSVAGKVLLINFWAAWCTPCREEIPQFVRLQEKYRSQGLEAIGISMEDPETPLREFYRDYKMNYPVIMGDQKLAEEFGGVMGLPTTFLIGRDGRIHAKLVGATDFSKLERELAALLNEKGGEMAESRMTTFIDESSLPPVRGFLHLPVAENGDGIVLTHGAGGNCQMPLLVALGTALAKMGLTALRFDLPFRQQRQRGAPSPANATRDQDGIRAAAMAMKKKVSGRVFAGGHSYGGRQTTMLAASHPELFSALLLSSYPLHPPGRPQQMRTAHFSKLRTPSFFVQGDRDPFASPEEISSAVRLIPVRTRVLVVEGGTHSLIPRRRDAAALAQKIAEQFREFVSSS